MEVPGSAQVEQGVEIVAEEYAEVAEALLAVVERDEEVVAEP